MQKPSVLKRERIMCNLCFSRDKFTGQTTNLLELRGRAWKQNASCSPISTQKKEGGWRHKQTEQRYQKIAISGYKTPQLSNVNQHRVSGDWQILGIITGKRRRVERLPFNGQNGLAYSQQLVKIYTQRQHRGVMRGVVKRASLGWEQESDQTRTQ